MSQVIAEGAAIGNLRLVRKIAAGGMAEVWEAKQTGVQGFERRVAVKVVLPHLSDNEEFIKMFFDEGRLAALLNHPNICQIVDLNQHDGTYYMAMEYIDGFVLSAVMKKAAKRGVHVPFEHCCQMLIGACAGLDYAHSLEDSNGDPLDIVHRDISPQNIMVTKNGATKVVDFGIAKAATQANQTRAGVLKGKYAYMSPEQATGKKLDQRSDVFALGIVLWELTTGHRLFRAENEIATLHKIIGGDYDPPSALRDNYPPGLETIVMKALSPNVDDRFQNCGEMQLALEDFLLRHGLAAGNKRLSVYLRWLMSDDEGDMPQSLQTASMINQAFDNSGSHSGVFTPSSQSHRIPLDGITSGNTNTGMSRAGDNSQSTMMVDPSELKGGGGGSKMPLIILLVVLLLGGGGAGAYFGGLFGSRGSNGSGGSGGSGGGVVVKIKKPPLMWIVRSKPEGASIYLNGRFKGLTPRALRFKAKTFYAIRLTKRGYKTVFRQYPKITRFLVRTPLVVGLQRKTGPVEYGSLVLKVKPSSAKVTMDGKALTAAVPGIFFLSKAEAGTHMLVVSASRYKREVKTFEISANKKTTLDIKLSRGGSSVRRPSRVRRRPSRVRRRPKSKFGTLTILSSPLGAAVFVGGRKIGSTPIKRHKMKPGSVSLTFKKAGYFPKTTSATVKRGEPELVSVQMKKIPVKKEVVKVNIGSNLKCDVFFKGRWVGRTPVYGYKLNAGPQTIEFRVRKWKVRHKLQVNVSKSNRRVFKRFRTGSLQVLSRPTGGTAFLNGARLGSANRVYKGIPEGTYRVMVRFPNGVRRQQAVKIRAGSRVRKRFFAK
jgi:serine/threonine-protein kinase